MFCRFDRFHKRPVNFHRYWWNSHRLGGDSHRCWRNSHRFGRNSHRCWRNSHRMRRNSHRMRRSSHRMRRNSHRTRRNFRLPSTWWRLSPVGAAVYFRRSSCNFGGIIFVSFVFFSFSTPLCTPPDSPGIYLSITAASHINHLPVGRRHRRWCRARGHGHVRAW